MKSLILVRHAKSSWEYAVGDKDRQLLQVGIESAIAVANRFSGQTIVPDAVFSSPANRALHTSMIFCRQLYLPLNTFSVAEELYDFSGNEVVSFIKTLNDAWGNVMVFGHNHAFTHIANSFGNTYIDNVPTSGLVHLRFSIDKWTNFQKGVTVQTIFPKDIKGC